MAKKKNKGRERMHSERAEGVPPGEGMFGCLRAVAVPAMGCGALALSRTISNYRWDSSRNPRANPN